MCSLPLTRGRKKLAENILSCQRAFMTEIDIVHDTQFISEVHALKSASNTKTAACRWSSCADITAVEGETSDDIAIDTTHGVEGCCFARPIGTDQSCDPANGNAETYIIDGA